MLELKSYSIFSIPISRLSAVSYCICILTVLLYSTVSSAQKKVVMPNEGGGSLSSTPKTSAIMDHSHLPIAVPENTPTPMLSISIYPDVMGGYNLILDTQNYHLVPPPNKELTMMQLMSASIDKNTGYVEGHSHLYVNGTKIQRLYGSSVHLPDSLFREGVNQITISINNHAHMYWTVNDRQILATLFIENDNKPTIKYKFESFPTTKR